MTSTYEATSYKATSYETTNAAERLEQDWFEDKEEQSRLEAQLQKLNARKWEMRSEFPGYDSRLRHDARFPDTAGEDAGNGTHNDRLSLDGDEPPVR